MLIRNPINPYPQNITVIPSQSNISFTFMGDRLGSYQLKIYPYSPSEEKELAYESKIVNIENYAYNNTAITFESSLEEMNIEPNKAYTWEVIMSYNHCADSGNFEQDTTFTSLRYFFQTTTLPIIVSEPDGENKSFIINKEAVEYDDSTIDTTIGSKNLNVLGYYYNGNIKYYYFKLFDEDENLIEETNKIFSNKIEYNFSGFLPKKKYILHLYTFSQDEQYTDIKFQIQSDYSLKQNISYPPILTCDDNEASVKIKWIKDSTSVPYIEKETDGDYTFQNDEAVIIDEGRIIYNNISSLPINMDKNNFAVGIKTTIRDDTTKILDYINNNVLYEIYMENYKLYLRYGEIGSINEPIVKSLGKFKEPVFGIQQDETAKVTKGYMFYEGKNYEILEKTPGGKNYYLLASTPSKGKFSILLQNNEGKVSCESKLIGELTDIQENENG